MPALWWQWGKAMMELDTITCADALDFLRGLPDDSIDMGLTSPPYDNLREYNGYTWDFEAIARELYRVIKPGGVLVWVVGDATINGSETLTSFKQALYFKEVCGFLAWDTMIWNKPATPGVYGKRYEQSFEYMFIFSKGEPKIWFPCLVKSKTTGTKRTKNNRHNGTKKGNGTMVVKEFKIAQNIWYIQTDGAIQDEAFPARFPEALAERHILTWSNPGDIVMDTFMGSGTTGKMAMKTGRHYIGCDISQEYVDLAQRRIANADPFQASDVGDGMTQLSLFDAP